MFSLWNKDKPVKIRFYFDAETRRKRLTWDDLETVELMQEGRVSIGRLKELAARFMVDEKNEYLPHEKAVKVLGSLVEADIQDVLTQFVAALNEAAVPKASGNGSNSPSEAGQATPFPDGQS